MHFLLYGLWGSTSLFTGIAAGASPTQMQVRTQPLSQAPFILKIFFFFSQLYVHIWFKDSVFQFWKFFLTTLVLPSAPPFLSRTCAIQLWNLVSSPQILLLLFSNFFVLLLYFLKISSTSTTFLLSFSFLLLFMFISPPEYSKYNIFITISFWRYY